jgi:hypothetical protein
VCGVRYRGARIRVLDRFTLDEVSAKIWWPLAMVALVALVLTVPAANHAADRARRESAATAILLSAQQIEPLTAAGATPADLGPALARIQQANPMFDAVRVWTEEGPQKLLVASSLQNDPVRNGTAGIYDSDIDGALSSGSRLDVTDRLPTGDTGPTTVHTFVRIDGQTGSEVAEFQASDAALLAQVHHDWDGYRILAAVAFLLLLGLALLSMREPAADIGVGVPFYPASLPPNLAIVDAERAVVIEHEDDRVRQRVQSLETRLDESERQRLKAEARLQQALTTLGTGGRNVPGLPPEPPTPTLPPSRTGAGRRATAEPAERPAAAAPIATPTDTPAPSVAPTPTPAPVVEPAAASTSPKHAAKKKPSRRSTQKPAAERTPTPRRSRAEEPADTPSPAPAERVTVSADDVAVSARPAASTAGAPASKEAQPDVVVLPAEQPAPVGASKASATAPAKSPTPIEEADPASEALPQLVPEHGSDAEPLADPGDLRARLARTAALKKPGSRERQDQREALRDGSSEQ